jgi:PBSX family phage terminase large subunit
VSELRWSDKQKEFYHNATHRWNVKSGATRSGKTFLDYYLLPMRLRAVHGKPGLSVILGATKGTLQRNIIEPLQSIWGDGLVTDIKSDNTAYMFGEKVHCIGVEKVNALNKIRGSSFKYLYGDEWATWNAEVFEMAKSRMDKAYSKADLTNNPEYPTHWAKKFLDSDADIFMQNYCIDDNPFLDEDFVENLKKEYRGTLYYNRYILGQWVRAEGACYPSFRHNPAGEQGNVLDEVPDNILFTEIGVDIGGNGSATVFSLTGYFKNAAGRLCGVLLDELYDDNNYSTEHVFDEFKRFIERARMNYKLIDAYYDSAEALIGKSFANFGLVNVYPSKKKRIIDRIRFLDGAFSMGRMYIMRRCEHCIDAVESAVWNPKSQKDERLDDGSVNIDSLDSWEYSWERRMTELSS